MKMLIHLLAFCLVATCNAELRTWTAVNGKEVEAEFVSNEKGIVKLKLKSGKVFEVPANKLSKKDNEFIRFLGKPEGVNLDELEIRFPEGIHYAEGDSAPYTGKFYEIFNEFRILGDFKDGKQEGLEIWFYKNGQKEREVNFKNGKENGLELCWNQNGQKTGEGRYKDGKQDGLWISWHGNGKKWSEGNFKEGKRDGLYVAWHESGQKKCEELWKNGKKISEKHWNIKGESIAPRKSLILEAIEEIEAEIEK